MKTSPKPLGNRRLFRQPAVAHHPFAADHDVADRIVTAAEDVSVQQAIAGAGREARVGRIEHHQVVMMATGRFAHYLKVMARDKIGSFMEASDCEAWLNRWILNYVNGNPDSGPELKAKFPLAEAKIVVQEIPGKPGAYNAVAWLRPWLQMEELTASLRMVASIPQAGG